MNGAAHKRFAPLGLRIAAIGFFILSLTGCVSTKETSQKTKPLKKTEVQQSPVQRNRDRALQHFIDGCLYDLKGEHAKAVLEYQDALRFDQDAAIYHALSRNYSLLGKHFQAAEAAREALRLDPRNIIYREQLAQVYLAAHEIDSAVHQYQAILELDSTRIEALYTLAQLYQRQAKPLEAITTYRKLLSRIEPDWEVLYQLSRLYENLQRYEDAANTYEQMLSIDPGNFELRKRLVELYIQTGKLDSALTRLNELLDVYRSNPDIQVLVGDLYLAKNEPEKALGYYVPVLNQDSVGIETRLHIGEALLQHAQRDSSLIQHAKPILEGIRDRWPDDWRPYWYLAFVGSSTGNDSLALKNLKKVTEINPRHADAWYYIGTIYFRWQQHDSAAKVLERSVELNPLNVDALGALALTYDTMKRYEDSDRTYEQALKLDPNNDVILNNYSYSLAERGLQLDRALQMAKQAVEKRPDNSAYLDTIGWVYFKLGRYQEARDYIRKAVQMRDAVGENGAILNEHLGDVYYKLNEKDKALEYWKRALQMNPNNQSLKEKINRGTIE